MKGRVAVILAILAATVGFCAVANYFAPVDDSLMGKIELDNGDLDIDWSRYQKYEMEVSETLKIRQSGTYILSGKIENGMIEVDVGDVRGKCRLVLNGVEVRNFEGPAIYVKSADDVVIETMAGSENVLHGEGFENFFDVKANAAVFSYGDLVFLGDGEVRVESRGGRGVSGRDDLTIRAGKLSIDSTLDGVVGKNSVAFFGGEMEIFAEEDGVKATNIEERKRGFIYFADGSVKISAVNNGMKAATYFIMDGGEVEVEKSFEGIEAGYIAINGGKIQIRSTDDGMNASGEILGGGALFSDGEKFGDGVDVEIVVNGGEIYIDSDADGIDSNGNLKIYGGLIRVDGPMSTKHGALDAGDRSELIFDGGELILTGDGEGIRLPDEKSTQNILAFEFLEVLEKNSHVQIFNEYDEKVYDLILPKETKIFVVGGEKILTGGKYRFFVNDHEITNFFVELKMNHIKLNNRDDELRGKNLSD